MVRSEAFTIEVAGEAVGIVVAQKRGFRFYASDVRFQHLEGQDFRSVADAERAARDLGRATSLPRAAGIAS
jgi:hypothetical protein